MGQSRHHGAAQKQSLRCDDCLGLFETKLGLAQHCVSSRHQAQRCCWPCGRVFGSPIALGQHNDALHPRPDGPQAIKGPSDAPGRSHWQLAHYHAIDTPVMSAAAASSQALLHGWPAEMWRHFDEHAVPAGQSLIYDVQVLRTTHTQVVDNAILTAEAVFGQRTTRRVSGLEELCHDRVGLETRREALADCRGHHDRHEAPAAPQAAARCLPDPGVGDSENKKAQQAAGKETKTRDRAAEKKTARCCRRRH